METQLSFDALFEADYYFAPETAFETGLLRLCDLPDLAKLAGRVCAIHPQNPGGGRCPTYAHAYSARWEKDALSAAAEWWRISYAEVCRLQYSGGPTQRHFGLAHLRQRADRVPRRSAAASRKGLPSAMRRWICILSTGSRDVSDLPTGAFLSACVDGDAQHTGEFWNVDELERRMRLADVRAVRLGAEIQCAWAILWRDWCSGELLDMLERTRHAGTDGCRSVRLGDSARPCAVSTPASSW